MTLQYGCLKCKVVSTSHLKGTHRRHEVQYHLRVTLRVPTPEGGTQDWQCAVNVGTSDSDDLLNYKIAPDYHNPIRDTLTALPGGFLDLTDKDALPALDFLRSNVLAETGRWRESDVMDGSEDREPYATLKGLFDQARAAGADVYIFGRTFPGPGIHDVHMNQGSTGDFINTGVDQDADGKVIDHNDVWQDGAVLFDLGQPEWSAYFTAFTKQLVPTDDRGNPKANSHGMTKDDDGSLAGQ